MRKLDIAVIITFALLSARCAPIGEPPLRIAISKTAGSAVFYAAQERGLFERYGVDVEIVELNTRGESWESFENGDTDAALMTYDGFIHAANSANEAGILMLVASRYDTIADNHPDYERECHTHAETEILVGSRSEMMVRRESWQKVLLAYEHYRLLAAADSLECASVNVQREHTDVPSYMSKMRMWKLHGITAQDSLLRKNGPFAEMEAQWHGRAFLTQSVTSQIEYESGNRSGHSGDYVR